ncbi:Short chain dehydrogenase sol3 [Lachnellula suecica]|uniref:Short chain dehydrogenase sol3 n=1 Tax=Lachnellula suecica TaxID=602035 RepID=A0A8T9BTA2_9HELO|nr:Short chain dehydrogenase sol3 [Lachnellula suecica]
MAAPFSVTPEKQASIPGFFYKQITFKLVEVRGVGLQGKTAIVTGSNAGIGFETSRQLLDLGLSKLILAVRDEGKGQAAAAKLSLGRSIAEGTIEDSIVAFAERSKTLERLDIVILNAGIAPATLVINERTGHNEGIQVNYLSTALLAILLLPVVDRITFVSSEVAGWTSFTQKNNVPLLAAVDKPSKINMLDQIFVSKLLGRFFIVALAKIVPRSVALINSASPATVHDSDFNREHDKTWGGAIAKMLKKLCANTASVGARIITDAAVNHGEETHGKKVSEQLWKETMEELSFAKVEDILAGIGK